MSNAARGNGDLFATTRADQILKRFVVFYAANPKIGRLFDRFALQLIASGRKEYGAAAIVNRIRWHIDVETRGDSVKINNDFIAYFARTFMASHRQHAAFFRTRRLRSRDKAAYETDIPVVDFGPNEDDPVLMEMLRRLATNTLDTTPPLKDTPP